jgi:hypothetical protein
LLALSSFVYFSNHGNHINNEMNIASPLSGCTPISFANCIKNGAKNAPETPTPPIIPKAVD